ncbi:nicotinate mononucleotide-dependent phosphoribosyltransferase CobT [Methanobacterium sp. ACI-7]|uniref:nicotinate mononucleotide-dependent phosphoribosyltransferase CobT n=1 Tax=unclassified Methanobacterium TaxID=2627676 RepID=UPI0039C265E0
MVNNMKCFGSESNLNELKKKNPLFLCVIATTKTSNIPGITGAGATPELTDYTPAADIELVMCGAPKCLPEIPQTLVGEEPAPTPAVITKACLELADIPLMVVDAGAEIKPDVPFIKLGEEPGEDIRTGKAVSNARDLFGKGMMLGKTLSKLTDHIVIGESTPAGTTTALGVLTALGYDARMKVSGSMPENPHDLKLEVVNKGLKAAGYEEGEIVGDALRAVEIVGDPMIPAVAGIVIGSSVPVTLAGGTQMTAACAVIKGIDKDFDFSRICIATTIFVAEDESSDINYITRQIGDIPIFAMDPEFEKSSIAGLKSYLDGSVKEGVGAGGALFAATLKDKNMDDIRIEIENICRKIF